jgi:hypothetical protein
MKGRSECLCRLCKPQIAHAKTLGMKGNLRETLAGPGAASPLCSADVCPPAAESQWSLATRYALQGFPCAQLSGAYIYMVCVFMKWFLRERANRQSTAPLYTKLNPHARLSFQGSLKFLPAFFGLQMQCKHYITFSSRRSNWQNRSNSKFLTSMSRSARLFTAALLAAVTKTCACKQ